MVTIQTQKSIKGLSADLLCLYQFESEKTPGFPVGIDTKLKNRIASSLADFGFKGKEGETLILEGSAALKRILLIGLGKKKDFSNDSVRAALTLALRKANDLKVAGILSTVPSSEKLLYEALEGALIADYQFKGMYQKADPDRRHTVKRCVMLTSDKAAKKTVDTAQKVFEAVNQCKDLVNLPSNIVTPSYLEQEARSMAKQLKKAKLTVLSEADAAKEKMGAFLAVAQGSEQPAKMIVLEYKGNPGTQQTYAVIGKGITFDSGGISLKPAKGMGKMKTDMAGSAAALAAFKAVVSLELKVNLIAIAAAAENMPSGRSYRPGDIITASNGKTIEITNTDAEGRMVLADALVYAQRLGATHIIDIATLTGACIVTFGDLYTGLMTNSSKWSGAYLKASAETGEKAWQLPMDKEYDELLRSDVCDLINANENRKAGTIVGGKFLQNFVEEGTEWIHLDIAGTSDLDTPVRYFGKHATGVPVRTIVQLLQREAASVK